MLQMMHFDLGVLAGNLLDTVDQFSERLLLLLLIPDAEILQHLLCIRKNILPPDFHSHDALLVLRLLLTSCPIKM